jgi:hypothetical protein
VSKRTKWLSLIGVIAALVIGWQVAAFANLTGSDFEANDGNLVVNTTGNTDWNRFNPPNWTGQSATGPLRNYRTTDVTDAGGWDFFGMLDEFKGSGLSNADSIYNGGTKQVDNCPTLTTKSAPNKDDIKRVYLSTKRAPVTVGGVTTDHVFLNLAFVRIPLNSTQSSAHLSFEFNQSKTACPGNNHTDPAGRSLVPRTGDGAGPGTDDLLVQYDFEGGTTTPTISISRWTGSAWTDPDQLTSSEAEAAINQVALTGATNGDRLAPPGPNTPENLGLLEFGEAGVDLTAAGVFSGSDCVNFGKASASSRSSGNSNSSNMFDIAGPGDFNLQNCGTIKIIKHTNPRGLNQDFSFTSGTGSPVTGILAGTCTGGSGTGNTPASFKLNDTGNAGPPVKDSTANTFTCVDVPAGSYKVTEGSPDPTGFDFNDVSCTASTGSSGTQDATTEKQVNITLLAGGTVTCTYVNDQQLGAIKVTKTSTKSGNNLADAEFSVTGPNNFSTTLKTGADGTACVDNLAFGTYTVTETKAPPGFVIDTPAGQSVTVDNNAKCSDTTYVGETKAFTDTPTADIQVNFKDGGSGELALVDPPGKIECTPLSGGTVDNNLTTGWDNTTNVKGIKISSSAVTVTCTIPIDP